MSCTCAVCSDPIGYGEEAWVLEVAVYIDGNRGPSRQVMLDDHGDYYQEPHVLHFQCWENALEEIRIAVADLPPGLADRFASKCTCCHSQVEVEEPYVLATYCELRETNKYPNFRRADRLERLSARGSDVCFSCINYVDVYFPQWGVFLQELTE